MSSSVYPKICRYCAYQERTHQEVRERLRDWGVWGDAAETLIVRLIEDNFLNEERFAKAFAGGRFRLKHWGRLKIEYALKQKGISAYCIRSGLAEIDEEDYRQTIAKLLEKKNEQSDEPNPAIRRQKLAQYLIGKGYESELVWAAVKELLPQ